jgi:hypothetical protein
MSVARAPPALGGWFFNRAPRPAGSALCNAAGALLDPGSAARRWLERPEERAALGRALAAEGTCSLLPLDLEGLEALRKVAKVDERVETFAALESGEHLAPRAWALAEPTAGGYRVWAAPCAVVLAATWPAGGQGLPNPLDERGRRFSPDTRTLCAALAARLPASEAEAARRLLRAGLSNRTSRASRRFLYIVGHFGCVKSLGHFGRVDLITIHVLHGIEHGLFIFDVGLLSLNIALNLFI